jgi:hypothetical protein
MDSAGVNTSTPSHLISDCVFSGPTALNATTNVAEELPREFLLSWDEKKEKETEKKKKNYSAFLSISPAMSC